MGMRVRFPKWWQALAIVYLLLEIFHLYVERGNRLRMAARDGYNPGPSDLDRVRLAFSHEGALVGLEFLCYFFVGLIVLVGLPTLIGIIIHAVKRKTEAVTGLLLGFVTLAILQLVLTRLFEM
jgi:hypothetical protein